MKYPATVRIWIGLCLGGAVMSLGATRQEADEGSSGSTPTPSRIDAPNTPSDRKPSSPGRTPDSSSQAIIRPSE